MNLNMPHNSEKYYIEQIQLKKEHLKALNNKIDALELELDNKTNSLTKEINVIKTLIKRIKQKY